MIRRHKEPKRKNGGRWMTDYPFPDDGGYYNPNSNAICFTCRKTARSPWRNETSPTCPQCGEKMRRFGCRIRIPRKTNERGWKLLERKHGWLKK